MSLPVRRTPQADADIDELWLFIARESVAAADRMVDRLSEADRLLSENPHLGQLRPDLADDLRHWPVRPYLILYRIEAKQVHIVRVLHGARNLPSALEGS